MPLTNPAKKLVLAAALISAFVAFCVYIPALGNGFVEWDDPLYVYENPNIRGFDLKWAFTASVVSTWAPLTLLSFALDYSIWGLDPFGYHLVNSILHSLNVFMLALLAARLAQAASGFGAKGLFMTALAAGLLFGIHPIHVESVAWVSERKDVLNAFFFLLALHSYVSYAKASRPAFYFLTLVFFVLSLLSKPMTVTMPVVLLIMDFYPLNRFKTAGLKKIIIEKLPFFGLSILTGVASIWSQTSADSLSSVTKWPVSSRIYISVRGFLFYICKTIVPVNLAPLYPRNIVNGLDIWFAVYALFLLAITAFTVRMIKRTRALFSSWAFYVITLLPVIGILQVGSQAAADRYSYLPSMGLVLLVAAGLGWLIHKKAKAFVPVLAALVVVSSVLSFLTVRQTGIWKDTVSLWTHEIKVFPGFPFGYVYRGVSNVAAGNYERSIADLTKGIELNPGKQVLFDAYSHRGSAMGNLGRMQEAAADFTQALSLKPENKVMYQNRASAYINQGAYALALSDLQKAASLEPVDGASYTELGLAYARTGDRENAYASLQKAVQLGDNAALQRLKALEGN